jgi:hypothetical protein
MGETEAVAEKVSGRESVYSARFGLIWAEEKESRSREDRTCSDPIGNLERAV